MKQFEIELKKIIDEFLLFKFNQGKTGDITPHQAIEYDFLIEKLSALLEQIIAQNEVRI